MVDPVRIPRRRWDEAREESVRAARAWRRSPALAMLAEAFDARAVADLDLARARAERLLADIGWADELLAPLSAALAADPLFEPPLKVHREAGRIGAVLFEVPAARIAMSVLTPREADRPVSSVIVPGHVAVTRYLRAGGASLRRWRVRRIDGDFDARGSETAFEIAGIAPRDGDVLVHDGRSEGQVIAAAASAVVTITTILRAGKAPVMREYRTSDGALLRAATTDDGASRGSMLLTFLRISGRADAGAAFAAMSRDPAAHVRWGAMREWLALDAAAALPRLAAMAERDASAEVQRTAAATLALVAERGAGCPA